MRSLVNIYGIDRVVSGGRKGLAGCSEPCSAFNPGPKGQPGQSAAARMGCYYGEKERS